MLVNKREPVESPAVNPCTRAPFSRAAWTCRAAMSVSERDAEKEREPVESPAVNPCARAPFSRALWMCRAAMSVSDGSQWNHQW